MLSLLNEIMLIPLCYVDVGINLSIELLTVSVDTVGLVI